MNDIRLRDVLEKVEITDAASEGKALARVDGMVVFIEGGVPGDVADVQVYHKKKNFMEARVVNIHKASPQRVIPFCEHFGTCGGCVWQHMNYETQLHYKQKQVEDVLQRVGKIPLPEISPIIGSAKTQFYRNRLDFAASNKRWLTSEELSAGVDMKENVLGFHKPGRFDKILNINKCFLQDDLQNEIRLFIRDTATQHGLSFYDVIEQTGFLRNVIIRSTSTGEWMVIIVFHSEEKEKIDLLMNAVAEKFPQITSLLYIINPKRNDTVYDLPVNVFRGQDHITEEMEGLKFKISAKSFYQTNSEQAYTLYKVAREFAQLTGEELVYDLYTGTGTIANFLAKNTKHVVGIENVKDAIEDAKVNSANNNITNTSFFAGDIKDTLTDYFILQNGKPDVIITDPPRSGMHTDVVKKIAEINPERVVYVSCNPSTQARDLNLLDEKYSVERIQPVDMFPHTLHVENVVLLKRK